MRVLALMLALCVSVPAVAAEQTEEVARVVRVRTVEAFGHKVVLADTEQSGSGKLVACQQYIAGASAVPKDGGEKVVIQIASTCQAALSAN